MQHEITFIERYVHIVETLFQREDVRKPQPLAARDAFARRDNYGSVFGIFRRGISVRGFRRHTCPERRTVLADNAFEFVVAVLQRFGAADDGVFGLELVEPDFVVLVITPDHRDRIGRIIDQNLRVDTRRRDVQAVVIHELRIVRRLLQETVVGVETLFTWSIQTSLFNAINIVFVIDCSLLVFTFAGKQPLVLVGMLCQILGLCLR